MTLQTIVHGYDAEALIDDVYVGLAQRELTKLLDSVADPDEFDPDAAKQAFGALEQKLQGK